VCTRETTVSYIKKMLLDLKSQIDRTQGYWETSTLHAHPCRQKLNRVRPELNDIISQIDLTDDYRSLHQTLKNTFCLFSVAHEPVCKINHILGHKASLDKFAKEVQITPFILSNHRGIKTGHQQ
jgi:hypothetical protein